MPAVKRSKLIEIFWKIHPWLYRVTGGRIGGAMMGMPVLLLTTKHRKTGEARTNALMYLPKDGTYVVIASYLGEPRHPAWCLNLKANPRAEIQVGNRHIPVVAHEAEGDERVRLWTEVVAREPGYAEYQQRTTRRIPVVVLEPATAP
jgi:deazaflavin-dependent oxidoreductase (nitroreductase family)